MRDQNYRRANVELISRPVAGRFQRAGRIVCGRCSAVHEITDSTRNGAPPEAFVTWAAADGWTKKGSGWRCPDCAKPHKSEEMSATDGVVVPMVKPNPVPTAAPIRDLTPKEMRAVMVALESYFDEKAGAYMNDMTDVKIGQEVDVPAANVAKVRREAFGEIKVAPEIAEAKALVFKSQELACDFADRIAKWSELGIKAVAEIEGNIAKANKLIAAAESRR
jgi:hypothetical protein